MGRRTWKKLPGGIKYDGAVSISWYANKSGRKTQAVCFSIGPVNIYFSYMTVVAFQSPVSGLCISKNYWGATTGRHLNDIERMPDKDRMPREEFETELMQMLAHYGLAEIGPVDKSVGL